MVVVSVPVALNKLVSRPMVISKPYGNGEVGSPVVTLVPFTTPGSHAEAPRHLTTIRP
jgi:hypothetical protein